ncbi:DUF6783 domain-containing protein [Robinsoniella sp. RHS]|uniref:DUF6783 domain-containing protein n=1 Tax=Robinsoniella sp. RHS TaxID=1504536 RepID=UPI00375215A9
MHSRHLHAPLCGIFAPNSGYVARYVPFIREKSPTNCDAQLSESNFQTRSGEYGPGFPKETGNLEVGSAAMKIYNGQRTTK